MTSGSNYLINEIYSCVQGEGPNLGKPSVLVRFQICNLRCAWCDTPYTHTMRSDEEVNLSGIKGRKSFHTKDNEIVSKIRGFENIKHIILSGGEPTLQNLAPLLEELDRTHSLEVESNGTQIPHLLHSTFSERHYSLAEWNISPKGRNAGQEIVPSALHHWTRLCQEGLKINFKFVIRQQYASEDVDEVRTLSRNYSIPTERIYLMAEGTDPRSQLESSWLEGICIQHGWRLTPRLHVILHGNQRGF